MKEKKLGYYGNASCKLTSYRYVHTSNVAISYKTSYILHPPLDQPLSSHGFFIVIDKALEFGTFSAKLMKSVSWLTMKAQVDVGHFCCIGALGETWQSTLCCRKGLNYSKSRSEGYPIYLNDRIEDSMSCPYVMCIHC